MGIGEFNSDDHYIHNCGQESLRRNVVTLVVNIRLWNAVLECSFKNNRMISVLFQGKPFNTHRIQVYAPTTNVKEAGVDQFYEDLQDLLGLTPKICLFHHSCLLCSVADWCPIFCDSIGCRLPDLSLFPRVCSNSCPLNWWCHPTTYPLLSPSSPAHNVPLTRNFFRESVLHIRFPKHWSFSFSIRPSNDYWAFSFFITGDWNSKVGSQKISRIAAKFGLGLQNEAGQRLTEFCQENMLIIADALFQQHKRGLYTWTSSDSQYENQSDYIFCSQKWRRFLQSPKKKKKKAGADCGSDHQLLIAKSRVKLKELWKITRPSRYNLNQILYDYTVEGMDRFKG